MVDYQAGNAAYLLENGDEFFPRVIAAMNAAQHEIMLETYLWLDDPVGREIKAALIAAAERGVWISAMIDAFGAHYFPQAYIDELRASGVHFYVYDTRWKGLARLKMFPRMHRKFVVIDGRRAFTGGINFVYNQTSAYGPNFKQDYAIEMQGPIVDIIRTFMRRQIQAYAPQDTLSAEHLPCQANAMPQTANVPICLVAREAHQKCGGIEQQFLVRIRSAKHRISIASAYFFPGNRMLTALSDAARRGVNVRLLVQGNHDAALAKWATEALYDFLAFSGVEIYEYWEHKLHAKLAAVDDLWSSVGSSNLDPLSLSLNLEANVCLLDRTFNAEVNDRILVLTRGIRARQVPPPGHQRSRLSRWIRTLVMFYLFRFFPGLSNWVPPRARRF